MTQLTRGIVLVVGAKGGVGTTSVAVELTKLFRAVGFDLADGQLAAYLERPAWLLSQIAFGTSMQRRGWLDQVLNKRATLMWAPECVLAKEPALAFVKDLSNRSIIVADGGIALPRESGEIMALAGTVVIVTTEDNSVAAWHVRRLQKQYPNATVISGSKEAARELAAQLTSEETK